MAEKIIEKLGKYEIVEVLGRGAMGIVYKARDPYIGRLVALKTINPKLLEDKDLLKRFYREAQAAGNLQHQNIVTIYELGESDGTPFIAMELLDGESLDRLIARREPMPLVKKLDVIVQFCRGLDYAHKRGVVHRDVKPANIVLTRDGNTKVVDFGIVHLTTATMTSSGMIMGTVNYMSPEQLRGEHVDARSDIFSVGIVIYEFLSYRKPFEGLDLGDVMAKLVSGKPPTLREIAPDLPLALEELVNKCLSKDPQQRFQSLEDLSLDLEPIARRLDRDAVIEMVKRGRELADRKDFGAAREVLRKALALDSSDDAATSLMTQVTAELRRAELAARVQPYLEQGERLTEQGQYDEACRALEEALKLDPQHETARSMFETARQQWLRVAEVRRGLEAGRQALDQGNITLAEALLRKTIELDSGNREAATILARVQETRSLRERRRLIEETLVSARQMISEGRYDEVIALLGGFEEQFRDEREFEQTLASAREALQKRRKLELQTAAIQALIEKHEYEEALRRVDLLAIESPRNPQLERLGETARSRHEAAEKRRRLKREVALVWKMVDSGQYDLAIQHGEQVVKDFGSSPEVGGVLMAASREKFLAEERKVEAICQSIQALLNQGRFRDAIREAENALRDFNGNRALNLLSSAARKGLEEQIREEARQREEAQQRQLLQQQETLREERPVPLAMSHGTPAPNLDPNTTILFGSPTAGYRREASWAETSMGTELGAAPAVPARTVVASDAISSVRPPIPRGVTESRRLAGSPAQISPVELPLWKQPIGLGIGAATATAAILIGYAVLRPRAPRLKPEPSVQSQPVQARVSQPQPLPPAPTAAPETVQDLPAPEAPAETPKVAPKASGLSVEDLQTLQAFQADLSKAIQRSDQSALKSLRKQAKHLTSGGEPLAGIMRSYSGQIETLLARLPSEQPIRPRQPATTDSAPNQTSPAPAAAAAASNPAASGSGQPGSAAKGNADQYPIAPAPQQAQTAVSSSVSDQPTQALATAPPHPSARAGTAPSPVLIYPAVHNPVSTKRYLLTYSLAPGTQYLGTIAIDHDTFKFVSGDGAGLVEVKIADIQNVKSSKLKHSPVGVANMTDSLEILTRDGQKLHFAVQNATNKPDVAGLLSR